MSSLVSIITPVKNVSKWIIETYESIVAQTYGNWEWIVIDDHSTDDTFEILKTIIKDDSRVIVQKATESGIINALNQAFELSKGIYLTRMDGDDLMPADRLDLMVKELTSHSENTIVTGKVSYFSKQKVSDGYLKYEKWLNSLVDSQNHFDHIYRECVVASPNWLMYRTVAEKIALFQNLVYPEDYDMCFHWQNKQLDIVAIPKITLLWREHSQRTSRNSAIYQQESFFRLKLKWFNTNYPQQSIGILGFGTKGKLTAKILSEQNRASTVFVYDNKTLSDKPLLTFKKADEITTDLLLISIFPPELNILEQQLSAQGYIIGINAFYL